MFTLSKRSVNKRKINELVIVRFRAPFDLSKADVWIGMSVTEQRHYISEYCFSLIGLLLLCLYEKFGLTKKQKYNQKSKETTTATK